MGGEGLLVLFAVAFVVGKQWKRVRGFVEDAVTETRRKSARR